MMIIVGFALFNNSIYGHSAMYNTLRLSVIRCTTYPSPISDQGLLKFRYGLYPFNEPITGSNVGRYATEFNKGLMGLVVPENEDGTEPTENSWFSWQPQNVIPTAVKVSENDKKILVRCYENAGEKTHLKIESDHNFLWKKCDLLENENETPASMKWDLHPYEIFSATGDFE